MASVISCNPGGQTGTNTSTYENNSAIDNGDKFVGSWKFYSSSLKKKNDHSMDGIICELERYKNTKETFVFHLFTGNDLVLSVQDKNTLKGENASMSVTYEESTGHIILKIASNNSMAFSKLK